MSAPGDVPPEILDRLRAICYRLPETYEEPAWVGVRWRIRKRTVVHVRSVEPDPREPYASIAPATGPILLLNFRSPLDEMAGLVGGGYPFYRAGWGTNVVGALLDDDTDWDEMAELLTESYCVMAPKRLSALVGTPHA